MHKHSALITQFAKMVAAGHPIDKLVEFKQGFAWLGAPAPNWNADEYRVAIAFVEGKPVFEGDKLWCMKYQEKVTVVDATGDDIIVQPPQEIRVNIQMPHRSSWVTTAMFLSWNPPKPSIADLKINIDASAINEAVIALSNLTAAANDAHEAMVRLGK